MTGNILTHEEDGCAGPAEPQGPRGSNVRISHLREGVRDGAVPDRPGERAVLLPDLLRPSEQDAARSGRPGVHPLQDLEASRSVRGEPPASGPTTSALRSVPPEIRTGSEGARPGGGNQESTPEHLGRIWHEAQRLRADAGRAARCVLDLWDRPAGGWPPTACGGPLSCDGSCAWAVVQQLQLRTGVLPRQPVATSFGDQVSGLPIGILKPGPVWHASVAPRRAFYGRSLCERRALTALDGLGDAALGEWREWTGAAFHIRRLLAPHEQASVGPVVDIRRTPEAARRAAALGNLLRHAPAEVLAEEIGEQP